MLEVLIRLLFDLGLLSLFVPITELYSNTRIYKSLVRKPAFCTCENKDADQLRGNREAAQRLCIRYTDSTIPYFLNPKFQASSNRLWLTARFVWDQVKNPENRFFHNEAHKIPSSSF